MRTYRRRGFLGAVWLLAVLALILFTTSSRGAGLPSRPNLLFILSDDQRWDALGMAGNHAICTSTLDRLAAEGVYFHQATIHVSQCSPSRTTLLTGLPPHQHGYFSNGYQRADVRQPDGIRVPTLPGLLQQAGYRTVLVGKWHIHPNPWNCGFTDVGVWMPAGKGPYLNPPLARGNSRQTQIVRGYTTEIFANAAVDFLNSPAAQEKPFFLWFSPTAPHFPMQPNPPRMTRLYAGKSNRRLLPPGFPKDANPEEGPWRDYYAAISHLDEQVGRVLDTLARRNLAQKTVVVYLSDNGFMMGSRDWIGKVYPYEESVRVPLIIRAPGMAARPGRNEAPVSSLDLPPTFLSLAGIAPPKEWPGRDLTPLLRGAPAPAIREAICEWADPGGRRFGKLDYRVVRTPRHKLIRWQDPAQPDELYDLVSDPHETHNLINSRAARPARDELLRRLKAWMGRTGDPALRWK